jgi:hypothetical protein
VAGSIFVAWNWRLALVGAILLHLGIVSILVHIHDVPGELAAGQVVAVMLCAAMLGIAGWLQPQPLTLQQGTNWPLRSLALLFVLAAWWFLDPGYTLPMFTQLETELMIWTALCGLALWSFSGSPLLGGVAVLLWSVPLFALASVLLDGSGLAAIVGIADIVIVLACGYLALLDPSAQRRAQRFLPRVLPRLRQRAARPWGLVRRSPQPLPETAGEMAGELAGAASARLAGAQQPSEAASRRLAAPQTSAAGPAHGETREETATL